MATTVTLKLDGKEQMKGGLREVADAITPLKTNFGAAESAAKQFKVTALGSFHEIKLQAQELANVDLSKVNAEFERMGGSIKQATPEISTAVPATNQYSAAAKGAAETTRQLTFMIQDMLSGGAMGGIKGAALGASNNMAMLAMQFGGLAGVITSIAVSGLPLLISVFDKANTPTKRLADETEAYTKALEENRLETERVRQVREALTRGDQERVDAAQRQVSEEINRLEKVRQFNLKVANSESGKYSEAEQRTAANLARNQERRILLLDEELRKLNNREQVLEGAAVAQMARDRSAQYEATTQADELLKRVNRERDAAKQKERDAAIAQGDVKSIEAEQQKLTNEIDLSARRLSELRKQFDGAVGDAQRNPIAKEMRELVKATQDQQAELKKLDAAREQAHQNEMARLNAEFQLQQQKDAAALHVQQGQAALDAQAAKNKELQDALKGMAPGIAEAMDPRKVASQIAQNRRDEAMRNGATDEEVRNAGRQGFRQFMSGGLAGTEAGQAEIRNAMAQTANAALVNAKGQSQLNNQVLDAMQTNMNGWAQAENDLAQLQAQLQQMQAVQQGIMNAANRRRGQGGGRNH